MIGASEPGGIAGWAVDLMEALGAPGAGLAVALENLFPPLPSEVILPLAGFTASQGDISLAAAIAWTTLGSLAGALVLYGLGALLGRERTRALAARIPLVEVSDIDRTEAWFARHGTKAVFFGRMVPIFRSFVSIPAGIERLRLPSFVLLTTAGSLIWNSAFIVAGYLLGQNWHVVETYAGWFQWLVVAVVVVAVAWWVTARVRKIRSRDT
ncbi:DedA family protein [Phytohabitans kaempferiae]|uniref:DedA family protein n=1 Tax=Phytohabitans kaempferiae TaxID=1620943 RepID=A0ABV6LW55_9ACTN